MLDNRQASFCLHSEASQALVHSTAAAATLPPPHEPSTRAKRLVDNSTRTRWTTLAPRQGEFSVDSARWWEELRNDPFHACSNMPLSLLLLSYMLCYLVLIVLTALTLYLIALGDGADEPSLVPDASWASCMQCAWQSLTTVGYGSVSTDGFWSSAVCATMVVFSLVFDAIGIGVFYQRLSNASIKARSIVHSTTACVCRANKVAALPMRLECRVHHLADHALVDPSVKLLMATWRTGQDGVGRVCIEFTELAVGNRTGGQVTPMLAFLQYPWSVVHYIDDASPLRRYIDEGAGPDGAPAPAAALAADHVEIICVALGTAASTGNTSESRASYTAANLRFGHRFADALRHHAEDGTLTVDLDLLSATLPEDPGELLLPQCY